MDATSGGKPLRFNNFVVDPREQELRVDGHPVKIGIRAFDVLMVLVKRNGHLVTKEELLELVWPKVVVEENTLQVHISTLRKTLGSEVIVTVPGRGYRFVAKVHGQESCDPDAQQRVQTIPAEGSNLDSLPLPRTEAVSIPKQVAPSTTVVPPSAGQASRKSAAGIWWKVATRGGAVAAIASGAWFLGNYTEANKLKEVAGVSVPVEKSIAVLPFIDMSEKKDQEYFSDGLTEELIDRLSHAQDLRVIARTSSFAFKGKSEDTRTIAARLGVAHLLEGSVRKSGGLLRITAQLIRASDGAHLWSQTYERRFTDIFKIQDEIAETVANALKGALGTTVNAGARSPNPDAYILLLQGNHFRAHATREDMERAIGFYRRAIALDPDYATAWASIARVYSSEINYGWIPVASGAAKARSAIEQALRSDEHLSSAHDILGELAMNVDWDWNAARTHFQRALALDPDNLRAQEEFAGVNGEIFGKLDARIAIERKMVARDPLFIVGFSNLANDLYLAHRFDESVAVSRQVLLLSPRYAGAHNTLAYALLYSGRVDEALVEAREEGDELWRLAALPIVYWKLGRRGESDARLKELEEKFADVAAFNIAGMHAYRGESDLAFLWLDRAYRQRDAGMTLLRVDLLFDSIRMDPRYHEMLVRMKLDGDPPPYLH